jgi:thiamine biosynthesis lipoprotein
VGIQHPRRPDAYLALAALEDRVMATSGDYATAFDRGFKEHHIVDPSTGRSPGSLASATVLAPTGLEADALSTAIFVLGPGKGLALAASRPGVDALLALKDGTLLRTPGFPVLA